MVVDSLGQPTMIPYLFGFRNGDLYKKVPDFKMANFK